MSQTKLAHWALCSIAAALPSTGQETIRVSVAPGGVQADGGSGRSKISANGRFVAFLSDASNLVGGDTNGRADIFVHDTLAGVTTRVSVDSAGVEANDSSGDPSISADGRYVGFTSTASNLVAGDTNGQQDAFAHDRATGATIRVNVDSSGAQANGFAEFPVLSSNGSQVVFASLASNLVVGDTNGKLDVFLRDLVSGTTTLLSQGLGGQPSNGGSTVPDLSADGSVAVFRSDASNLVTGDTNWSADVFAFEFATGTLARMSVRSNGVEGNGRSSTPVVSFDGRFVAFESLSTNLAGVDTNGSWDVFIHDRQLATTALVSVNDAGVQGSGLSAGPSISHDGRFVGYRSAAANLVARDTNGLDDMFVHDRLVGTVELVSRATFGALANGGSSEGSLAFGGKSMAFVCSGSNLVAGDTNGCTDIFVRRIAPLPETARLSALPSGVQGDGASGSVDITDAATFASFTSVASNLVPGDTNGVSDVFVRDLTTGDVERVSVSSTGAEADADCREPSISADGRYVAFTSLSMTLVAGDTNGEVDVFVHDRVTGTTHRVSQTAAGAGGNSTSQAPSISADGRFVAFSSGSSNFPGSHPFSSSVYVADLQAGTLAWVSRGDLPDLSADGRFVALMSNVILPQRLVYLVDRQTGSVRPVSVDALGATANGQVYGPSVSADGRFVAFHTNASNLVPGVLNNVSDVYVHDTALGHTERMSLSSTDAEADGASEWARISSDGRHVVFMSAATNLVPGLGATHGVYLRDRITRMTTRIDVDNLGAPGDSRGTFPAVSRDAQVVAFSSGAGNLVPADTNGQQDVFARRRCDLVFQPFGLGLAGTSGLIPHLGGTGRTCSSYNLSVWNALSGAPGLLAIGFGEGSLPLLGGTFYLDFGYPIVTVPFVCTATGLPGLGRANLSLGYLGGLAGTTLVLQALVFDVQAPAGIALTGALRLRINN